MFGLIQRNRPAPALHASGSVNAALLAALSLTSLLLVAGCHGSSQDAVPSEIDSGGGGGGGGGGAAGMQTVASSASMRGSDVLATVNGQSVTAGQLYDALQHYVPARVTGFPNNNELNQPAGRAALRSLIENDITLQFAKSNGVPVTAQELDAAYNDQILLQGAKITLPLGEVLTDQGYTEDSYKQEVLAPQVAQFNVASKAENITPGDVQTQYSTTQSQYVIPARVHIHRIVCASKQDAQNVYSGIKAGRALSDFAGVNQVGTEEGGNPADNTDFTRWIDPTLAKAFGPAISAQLLKAKAGDLLPPVNVQGRWWVIQVTDAKPSTPLPFDQVSNLVRNNLIRSRSAAASQDLQVRLFQAFHSSQISINQPQYQDVAMEVHMAGVVSQPPAAASAGAGAAPVKKK